jgi:hypothetical protein
MMLLVRSSLLLLFLQNFVSASGTPTANEYKITGLEKYGAKG